MRNLALLALSGMLALAGPALAQDMVDGKPLYRTAEPTIWAGEAAKGPLTHRMTGAVFPDAIGAYRRTTIFALGKGDDVGVNYETARSGVTVYLFKPSSLPEHRLKGAISSFAMTHQGAFVWSDGPFDVDGSRKLRLFKATYKTGIGPDTVMDYLYFGELGGWTVKVRGTLNGPKDVTEEQAIDQIVRGLPWATILQANGDCTGIACDAARPMAFNHNVGEMFLTSVIQSGKGKLSKDPAQQPLFTRKVDGRTWDVSPLDPALAELFVSSFGGISVAAPLYTLTSAQGSRKQIVRFFTGTPDQALFDREVDGLTRKPETSIMVPVADAAEYAPF